MKKLITDKKEKISRYTAVAGAFLASGAVNSQIIYVDVNPDEVIDKNNSPFSLDLNSDVVNDFDFFVSSFAGSYSSSGVNVIYSGSYAGVSGGLNAVVMDTAGSFPQPVAMGNVINGAAVFGSNSQMLGSAGTYSVPISSSNGPFAYGNFLGLSDQYLGVKFSASGNTHFGWIRLDVAADASTITIKDYAYNSIPLGQILAGLQEVGLENVSMNQKVSFKSMLDEAIVNVTPDLIGGKIIVTDLSGKEVASSLIVDVNTKISYAGIETGIYMLVASFNDELVSKKVYIR